MFLSFLLSYSVGVYALLALNLVLGTSLPLEDLERLLHSSADIASSSFDADGDLRRHSVPLKAITLDDGDIASALMNGMSQGKEQPEVEAVAPRHPTSSTAVFSDADASSSLASFLSSDSEESRPEKRLKSLLVPSSPPAFLAIPKLSFAQRRVSLEMLREQVYIQLGSRPRFAKSTDPLVEPYDDHLTAKDYGIFIAELANRPPWVYVSGPPESPTRFLIRQASHKHDSFQSVNRFKARGRNVRYFEAWQDLGETDSGLLFDFLGVFRVPQESSSKFKAEVLRDSVFRFRQYIVLSPSTFVVIGINK